MSHNVSDTNGASPPLPETGWYYAVAGAESGPVTRDELLGVIEASPETPAMRVWHAGLADWIDVRTSGLLGTDRRPPPLPSVAQQRRGLSPTLFSFSGRMARRPYLLWSSLLVVLYVALVGVSLASNHLDLNAPDATAIRIGFLLPFLWSVLALTAKRLHDLNRSAKHLLWVMPVDWASTLSTGTPARQISMIASGIVGLWLVCKRGTVGRNAFGADPLDRPGLRRSASAVAAPPVASRRKPLFWVVGFAAVATVAAVLGYAAFDDDLPFCSDPAVAEKVKAIVAANNAGDRSVFLSGGIDNVTFSFRDARTLSNGEPPHGRTCVATIALSTKSGLLGKGEVGSMETTYTIQLIDNQDGRYVVTVKP